VEEEEEEEEDKREEEEEKEEKEEVFNGGNIHDLLTGIRSSQSLITHLELFIIEISPYKFLFGHSS
jgi:hypothetical protein